jgi:hypothetical protein
LLSVNVKLVYLSKSGYENIMSRDNKIAPTIAEFYWLIGILEGEGSFMKPAPSLKSPRVVVTMKDKDVVDRCGKILKLKTSIQRMREKNPRHSDVYRVCLGGRRAIALMEAIYPHMSKRRKVQIENALGRQDMNSNLSRVDPAPKVLVY